MERHAELPPPGIKPMTLQWKHGALTTGPPGKSNFLFLNEYSTASQKVAKLIYRVP